MRSSCMVLTLEGHGIDRNNVDEWFANVKVPTGFTKLRHHFFRDRIVNKTDAHIRGFASEMLSCVVLMGLFLDVVVAPQSYETI